MTVTSKSLIVDLLSTLRPGSAMPVGALVEAGALFGMTGNNVRVSVARLLADGQIGRDERGHYRLGAKAKPIGRRVRSWRELHQRTRSWSGGWLAIHSAAAGRSDKQARLRASRLLGFAELRPGLWIRPDNLTASVDEVRSELALFGLPEGDLVFALRDLDGPTAERAESLWNVERLRRSYRELLAGIGRSTTRLETLSPGKAMVESYLLGGRALRELVLDPLLPAQICPSDERDALREAMRDYDRLGRLAWATLLKRYDVPYLRTPLGSRVEAEHDRSAQSVTI